MKEKIITVVILFFLGLVAYGVPILLTDRPLFAPHEDDILTEDVVFCIPDHCFEYRAIKPEVTDEIFY